MKKVLKFISALALVLPIVACEQENPDNGTTDKPGTETPGAEGEDQQGAPIEVIGLKAPEYGPVGGTFVVEGLGFPETSKLVLKTADGKEVNLVTKAVESGLSAEVPADAAQAQYQLLATAETYKPLVISEKFNLYIKKSVASVENVMDMGGMIFGKVRWSAEYAGEKLTSVTKTISMPAIGEDGMPIIGETGQQFEEMAIVYTVAENKSVYTFTNDAGMPGFTLTVTDDKVVENTVERESGNSDEYSWLYNEKGYITELKAGKTYYSYTFDAKNNLVETTNSIFTYSETGAKGEFNPYHLDAAMCMTIDLNDTLEDFQAVAVLLGLTGTPSANIPATATPDELPIVPVIDKDGYVTSLTAGGESVGMELKWTITYR